VCNRGFNELENYNEKRGGQVPSPSRFIRLNNFLSDINAESIKVNGCLFTWKKRFMSNLIYERLDRAIAIADWGQLYPDASLMHGCFSCSDHCPIILNTNMVVGQAKAYLFRYQNFWAQYQKSTELIRKIWRPPVGGTQMYQMVLKLRRVRYELRVWANQHFGNFAEKVTKNEDKIKFVEGKLLDNPSSFRLNSWMSRLLKHREQLQLFNQNIGEIIEGKNG